MIPQSAVPAFILQISSYAATNGQSVVVDLKDGSPGHVERSFKVQEGTGLHFARSDSRSALDPNAGAGTGLSSRGRRIGQTAGYAIMAAVPVAGYLMGR